MNIQICSFPLNFSFSGIALSTIYHFLKVDHILDYVGRL